jgi:hypothetical protein
MLKILGSSRVWAAFLAIVFVLLTAYVPVIATKLDQTAVIGAVVALASFIVAESVAGQSVGWAILKQFKFWALFASLGFIFVRAFVPNFLVSESLVQDLITAIGAASVGLSYRPIGTVR